MTKLKVVTVVGTRPEIIRLSRVMAALDRYCDHTSSTPVRTTTTS
jgi:UDP-N-acetylglucosamine 2-epimerase